MGNSQLLSRAGRTFRRAAGLAGLALTLLVWPGSAKAQNLLVSDFDEGDVLRFDTTAGAFLNTLLPVGSGGLDVAAGLAFGPDGNLYVADYGTSSADAGILRFNGATGAALGSFGSGDLISPSGLFFDPLGSLYVADYDRGDILRYNPLTGALLGTFGGAELISPTDLVSGLDGNLYVADYELGSVLRYNATTGAFVDAFVDGADPTVPLVGPNGLLFGPDGNLYVADYFSSAIQVYDGSTGAFLRSFGSRHPRR